MPEATDQCGKHNGGHHPALVKHLCAGAEEKQDGDEPSHNHQVSLVQTGIPNHGSPLLSCRWG